MACVSTDSSNPCDNERGKNIHVGEEGRKNLYTVQWIFFDRVKFRIICPDELVWWHYFLIGVGVLLTVLAVTVGLLLVSPQIIHYSVGVLLWLMCAVYCVQVIVLLFKHSQFHHRRLQETSDTLSSEVCKINVHVYMYGWCTCHAPSPPPI